MLMFVPHGNIRMIKIQSNLVSIVLKHSYGGNVYKHEIFRETVGTTHREIRHETNSCNQADSGSAITVITLSRQIYMESASEDTNQWHMGRGPDVYIQTEGSN